MSVSIARSNVRYSSSETGTPADLSARKNATNIARLLDCEHSPLAVGRVKPPRAAVIAGASIAVASGLRCAIIHWLKKLAEDSHGLDDSHPCRNLHRTGDQRLSAGRVLMLARPLFQIRLLAAHRAWLA